MYLPILLKFLRSVCTDPNIFLLLLARWNIHRQYQLLLHYNQKRMIGPSKVNYVQTSSDEEPEQREEQLRLREQQRQRYREEDQPSDGSRSWYQLGIPVDSFASLKGHSKGVACVAVAPKGHRMATGGLDYHVRLWDFHGMNKNMNSFRTIEPFTGNAIRQICFNTTGTHLMIINGNKQITFIDKDGARNLLTVKGYMYVKDLNLTKGHTNTVHDAHFHPTLHNQFVTCSADGSIRMWDIEQKLEGIEKELAHKTVIRCKDDRGAYVGITGINYSQDGKWLFGGCLDGSLQVFSTKHNLHRPEMIVRSAHVTRQQYSSIVSFEDSQRFATRNTDGTMKIWDLRRFDRPIVHERDLPNRFPGNKMCFSPNQKYLLVGTSIDKDTDTQEGYIHFYDTSSYERVKTMSVGKASVNGVEWSPVLNQIVAGLSNGEAHIFFDERLSQMGALKAVNKQPRRQKDPILGYKAPVYLPHSLPMYKQKMTNNPKRDLLDVRKDTEKSAKPLYPTQGPHKFGRQNEKAFNFIQHMIQAVNANPQKKEDARKALWQIQKYTKEKQEYTSAYQFTQPTPEFHESPQDTKEFQFLQTIEKICPHCGLKLCTCVRRQHFDEVDEASSDEEQNRKG